MSPPGVLRQIAALTLRIADSPRQRVQFRMGRGQNEVAWLQRVQVQHMPDLTNFRRHGMGRREQIRVYFSRLDVSRVKEMLHELISVRLDE